MAKLQNFAPLLLLAALIGCATATVPQFVIQGRVYCDNCRAGFETNVTEYISGAKVHVECMNYTSGEVMQRVEGVTEADGTYKIAVQDDHQEEICEVVLKESPIPDCSEINGDRSRARILLTRNVGIIADTRYANSLGFYKDEPLAICGELLKLYALAEDDL